MLNKSFICWGELNLLIPEWNGQYFLSNVAGVLCYLWNDNQYGSGKGMAVSYLNQSRPTLVGQLTARQHGSGNGLTPNGRRAVTTTRGDSFIDV